MKAWFDDRLAPRRTPVGHWVPAGARLPTVLVRDPSATLVVGAGALLTALEHAGSATFGRQVAVRGRVAVGRDLVLGAGCRIAGPVRAGGRIVVQHGRIAGPLRAGGDVLLVGDSVVGDVVAGGDIVVVGQPRTGKLEPGGRVVTRAW